MLTSRPKQMDRIPSGSYGLDTVLGGGWPMGRIHEILGWESSGKSTLALHAIVEAQKMGLVCGLIDTEHAIDTVYAVEGIGVNPDAKIHNFGRGSRRTSNANLY